MVSLDNNGIDRWRGTIARRAEATALIGVSWWLVVLLGIVGLARRGKRRFRTGLDEAGWRFRGRWEPWMWFGLAGLWTWPAVRAGPGMLVGRHFDALGTIWTISAADRLLPHLTDARRLRPSWRRCPSPHRISTAARVGFTWAAW